MMRARQTDQRPPADILKLNAWMKDYAAKVGAIYADYFTALVDEKGWLKESISADGLHPNAEGYKLMVPVVEAAIQKALPYRVGPTAGIVAGASGLQTTEAEARHTRPKIGDMAGGSACPTTEDRRNRDDWRSRGRLPPANRFDVGGGAVAQPAIELRAALSVAGRARAAPARSGNPFRAARSCRPTASRTAPPGKRLPGPSPSAS